MKYKVYYGITACDNIDVTNICIEKCSESHILYIAKDVEYKNMLFSDPYPSKKKYIFIQDGGEIKYIKEDQESICFDYEKGDMILEKQVPYSLWCKDKNEHDKLVWIHEKLQINHGTFKEEDVEQRLVAKYITGKEKVLELGGNIGRVALVTAYILNHHDNIDFVSMECNTDIAIQLCENRTINKLQFYIEPTALSKRALIQNGWHNVESNTLLPGHLPVTNTTMEVLKQKYRIDFDTLIVDCEEAFYFILMDMPEILSGIQLIIMENDYLEQYKKSYVDEILIKNNFHVIYCEKGGWPEEYNRFPCYHNIYEVWKKY